MQLDELVHQVQDQLTAAAALGDDRAREVATTLAGAIAPAVRLAIMSALAAAADEITAGLLDAPGSPRVAIRLNGDDVQVEVTQAQPDAGAGARTDDGDATARISLRLSDALKSDVELAASGAGISVNSWLVRAATTALSPARGTSWEPHRNQNTHHVTGWIDG
jgi:hypothetical protein